MKLLFSLISFLFVELMSNMVLNVIRPIYNMCRSIIEEKFNQNEK
jgi:hypothetical protein